MAIGKFGRQWQCDASPSPCPLLTKEGIGKPNEGSPMGFPEELNNIRDCSPLLPGILVGENPGGSRVSFWTKVRASNSEEDLLGKRLFPEELSGGFRLTLARITNPHSKVQMSFWGWKRSLPEALG